MNDSYPLTSVGDNEAALAYLASRINYERAPPQRARRAFILDRMRRLLSLLGNPQDALRIVHVAGTKGKGSTSAMIASALTAAGYRTGLFTSPHLTAIEQRWQVDGQLAAPGELSNLVALVREAADQLDADAHLPDALGRPTFFELSTAMGLLHFKRQGCTAAVLEVGLGGRLDSTNVCQPELAVITTISFDHTKLLGNTLAAIAGEKAGILKPGIPVVVGVTQPEPRDVIEQRARELGCPLFGVGTHFGFAHRWSATPLGLPRVDYQEFGGDEYRLAEVELAMRGEHQAANGAVAIAALRKLAEQGWRIPEAAIRQGLASATCPARIEVFAGPPLVILDAAHNVASVEALVRVLNTEFRGQSGRLIFAASADKDIEGMLARLVPRFESLYLTRFLLNPRSVSPARLAGLVAQLGQRRPWRPGERAWGRPTVWHSPEEAWRQACGDVRDNEFICIAGSFFLAAELRPVVMSEQAAT